MKHKECLKFSGSYCKQIKQLIRMVSEKIGIKSSENIKRSRIVGSHNKIGRLVNGTNHFNGVSVKNY